MGRNRPRPQARSAEGDPAIPRGPAAHVLPGEERMRTVPPRWTLSLLTLFAAALLAGACGGDGGNDAYGERGAIEVSGLSVTVELKDIRFRPQGIRVKPGTKVTWINNDPIIHNVRQVESVFLSPDVVQPGD